MFKLRKTMKINIITLLFCAAVFTTSCKEAQKSEDKEVQTETEVEEVEEEILVGSISREQLEDGMYATWFDERYDEYAVDSARVAQLDEQLDGVNITAFMGTWCSDSQREVPAFYKVLDAADADVDHLIAMTRDKTTPKNHEENLNISNVPTLIFFRDGEELGRIVEYPIESLEADMLKILSGEEYKHAYAE